MKKTLIAILFISGLWGCGSTRTADTAHLKALHPEAKAVQTHLLFEPNAKVISLQIAKGEQLKEHISEVPALLVCISGKASYSDEKGTKVELKQGNYVFIDANVIHKVEATKKSNFLLIK